MGLASLEAKRQLELQGIQIPNHPPYEAPELPEEITGLSDPQLMTLMVQLAAWGELLNAQVSAAEIDERYAESALEKIRAIKALQAYSDDARVTATKAKASVWDDEDYSAQYEKFQELHAYRKLIATMADNIERRGALCSRELTRRANSGPREGRIGRLGT